MLELIILLLLNIGIVNMPDSHCSSNGAIENPTPPALGSIVITDDDNP